MNKSILCFTCLLVASSFQMACQMKSKKSDVTQPAPEAVPKLIRPTVRKVWVPDQIIGDEYVSGHWKFLIERNSVWAKSEK